jgi:hypothetical protein
MLSNWTAKPIHSEVVTQSNYVLSQKINSQMRKRNQIVEEELRQVQEAITRSRKRAILQAQMEDGGIVPQKKQQRKPSTLRGSGPFPMHEGAEAFRSMPLEELLIHEKGILNLIDQSLADEESLPKLHMAIT